MINYSEKEARDRVNNAPLKLALSDEDLRTNAELLVNLEFELERKKQHK